MPLSNVSIGEVPTRFIVKKSAAQQFDGSEFRFIPDRKFPYYLSQLSFAAGPEDKTWALNQVLVDTDGSEVEVLIRDGTIEEDVIFTPTSGILFGPRDYVKLTTTTATAAMTAAIWFKIATGLRGEG